MVRRALVIGCDYIGTPARLNGCIRDANNIQNMLIEKLGFSPRNVIFLADTEEGARPTRARIILELIKLTETAQVGDFVFISYSGHGTQVKDTDGDEADRQDEALVPIDYQTKGLINDDFIRRSICMRFRKGVKVFFLMDCCHSGSNLDLKYGARVKGSSRGRPRDAPAGTRTGFIGFLGVLLSEIRDDQNEEIAVFRHKATSADIIAISGCQDDQVSLEIADAKGKSAGVLTTTFLAVLASCGYQCTRRELLEKIRAYITSKKLSSQIPQLSMGMNPNLDEVVFPW